jgi:hypothetical protein
MADLVYNTFVLGIEDHLLDMFDRHDVGDLPEEDKNVFSRRKSMRREIRL